MHYNTLNNHKEARKCRKESDLWGAEVWRAEPTKVTLAWQLTRCSGRASTVAFHDITQLQQHGDGKEFSELDNGAGIWLAVSLGKGHWGRVWLPQAGLGKRGVWASPLHRGCMCHQWRWSGLAAMPHLPTFSPLQSSSQQYLRPMTPDSSCPD